jgi:hypothetical protein
MAGWIFIFFVLAHSVDSSLNPSLSGFAFYSITLRLSLRLTLRQAFPDGVLYKNTVWFISCDLFFCCMEHFGLCSFDVPRNNCETYASYFSRSKLNLLMNDWRFFRLTERSDHLFSSNL